MANDAPHINEAAGGDSAFRLNRQIWYLFAILLVLDVVSLLLDKVASNQASIAGDGIDFYKSLIRQAALWLSLAIGPFQLIAWTKILSKVELGLAYAISSLHMPLTMIAAFIVLNESLPLQIWLGGLLITIGVVILGSERKE